MKNLERGAPAHKADRSPYRPPSEEVPHSPALDSDLPAGDRVTVSPRLLERGEAFEFDGSAETDGSFRLIGGIADDTLGGGGEDDFLRGGRGDDSLSGNAGNDKIRGGLGADRLDGGAGADRFIYGASRESTGLNYDTIVGFNFAEDQIVVRDDVAGLAKILVGTLDDLSFNDDLAGAVDAALAANGAVLFTANGGDHAGETFLVFDADGNGSYGENLDLVIHLEGPVGVLPNTPDFLV